MSTRVLTFICSHSNRLQELEVFFRTLKNHISLVRWLHRYNVCVYSPKLYRELAHAVSSTHRDPRLVHATVLDSTWLGRHRLFSIKTCGQPCL